MHYSDFAIFSTAIILLAVLTDDRGKMNIAECKNSKKYCHERISK